jgi:hypothetical protein
MLVVGHLKERHLSSDIRCDRGSPLGNPFELVSEEFRDEVIDAWEQYLKLVIRRNNARMGDQFVDPREISKTLPISKTWKQPNAKTIVFELHQLIPLYQVKRVHRLMCWCRRSDSVEVAPKCHCDVIIRCVKKWSEKSAK